MTRPSDDAESPEVARAWSQQRLPFHGLHLDSAAAGRCPAEAMLAAADHAALEAQIGGYVAEAQAGSMIEAGRSALAGLLGMPSLGLAFVESASAGVATVLRAWPLQAGDTVAVTASEWGPNLAAFADYGLRIVELATHACGELDLDQFECLLAARPPAFVHLIQVASHRSLIQPVSQAAALCRAAGVPLWVDAAQALGHVDTDTGADVVYATGRKWIAGPRGVGMLAIAERWWSQLRITTPALDWGTFPLDQPVQQLESREANIAARVGLCVAVNQHLDAGPPRIWQRLAEVGRMTREALVGIHGWELVDPVDAPGAIISLRPTGGQDVATTRGRLLGEHQILTSCAMPARAPHDMTGPLLRISPHVDCTHDALHRLRYALQ